MVAKTTASGTAAGETALCAEHDTPKAREDMERRAERDVTGPWVQCDGNDELECQVCGRRE